MRPLGTLAHENEARKFTAYLERQGIHATCDMAFEPTSGQMSYTIWIHDEDEILKAKAYLDKFLQNPSSIDYELPATPQPIQEVIPKKRSNYLTTFLIALCVFIFFLDISEQSVSQQMTPLEKTLLIDTPPAFPPFWQGAYFWALSTFQGKSPALGEGPLLVKVREGEVWRLFTPCLLHRDFLHILFNMIWVWILGRAVEQRIGAGRTLALTLIAGVGSNLAQYFMSGPLFLGYSGIVTALAGFIWVREKIAPWEGYPIHRSTLLFLAFFVLIFFALQLASFLFQSFTAIEFEAGIANTAHIAGALIGMLLARFSIFKARGIR